MLSYRACYSIVIIIIASAKFWWDSFGKFDKLKIHVIQHLSIFYSAKST